MAPTKRRPFKAIGTSVAKAGKSMGRSIAKAGRIIADTQLSRRTTKKMDATNGEWTFIGRGRMGRADEYTVAKRRAFEAQGRQLGKEYEVGYEVEKISHTGRKHTARKYIGPDGEVRIFYPEKVTRGRIGKFQRPTRKSDRKKQQEKQARKPGTPMQDHD